MEELNTRPMDPLSQISHMALTSPISPMTKILLTIPLKTVAFTFARLLVESKIVKLQTVGHWYLILDCGIFISLIFLILD